MGPCAGGMDGRVRAEIGAFPTGCYRVFFRAGDDDAAQIESLELVSKSYAFSKDESRQATIKKWKEHIAAKPLKSDKDGK